MADVRKDEKSGRAKMNRGVTFLGRMSSAVREQNWFAVFVELSIVVLGVLIAFQITEWGQQRADRAKEQSYLVQLAQDLRETERQIAEYDAILRNVDGANSKLLRSFFLPESPPADSIIAWRLASIEYRPLTPVTATAEALIASGDLALIRNDSLRTQITAYVPWVKNREVSSNIDVGKWWDQSVALANRYDLADMYMLAMGPREIDSLALADPYFLLPSGDRKHAFPFNVEDLLSDRQAYNNIRGMLEFKTGMQRDRAFVLEDTRALLELVEYELSNQ